MLVVQAESTPFDSAEGVQSTVLKGCSSAMQDKSAGGGGGWRLAAPLGAAGGRRLAAGGYGG